MSHHETLVRWYLRFNGYLGVENFILHEPTSARVAQGGEFDTLAVRFPFSREKPGFEIRNDEKLIDKEASEKNLVDFVIAEVKSGKHASLNKLWRPPDPDGKKRSRLEYLVKWLGPLQELSTIKRVATGLQKHQRHIEGSYLFRLVYFCKQTTSQAVPPRVPQITFKDIATFIVGMRSPCWKDHGFGVTSAHDQWDPLIKNIWEIGDPKSDKTDGHKIERILQILNEPKSSWPKED
jgi:hypothetical protein